jgi:hypothetical protein
MKNKETLEEFIKEVLQDEFFTNISEHKKAERLIEIGAKWQAKLMYSEEDMVKFVSFVGKNYIKAKGFYYMKGDFEKSMKVSIHQILEQFNNK